MPNELSTASDSQTQSETQLTQEPSQHSEVPSGGNEPIRINDPNRPSWMQGKTIEEIADLAQTLYGDVTRLARQSAPPTETPVPMNTHGAPTPPDPNLMYSNPAEYQRQFIEYNNALVNAHISQLATPFAASLSQTARALSKMGKYKDIWARWEPEIERMLEGIPEANRTQEMYDRAASLVKAEHFDELLAERLAEASPAGGGAGTERATSMGNTPTAGALGDKLDEVYDSDHPFWVNARAQGVTKDMIRAHCAKVRISVDDYVHNAQLGSVIVGKNGYERRSD